jgi:flagellar FliJ protein
MHTFKLQAVLDHRQFIEDGLKKELAEVKNQASEAQHQLEALENKEMNTLAALKEEQTKGLSSDKVAAYHAYLESLMQRIHGQRQTVAEINERVVAKQGKLLEALKERQILEKLKEKDFDRFHQEMLHKERRFIDEIAVNQFVRKSLGTHNEGE